MPDKELNKFLVSLPRGELKAFFIGLISGDGHIRKDDGRISFIQKSRKTKDWFQIIAFRLGYHSIQNKNVVYLTNRGFIGIRGTNGKGKSIKKIYYRGKVWCPKTPNGTWVARRNGKIFITGNTFPEELVRQCILAGCPPKGTVLDPFAGSGTTGKVAQDLNREAILIELILGYLKIIKKRCGNSINVIKL